MNNKRNCLATQGFKGLVMLAHRTVQRLLLNLQGRGATTVITSGKSYKENKAFYLVALFFGLTCTKLALGEGLEKNDLICASSAKQLARFKGTYVNANFLTAITTEKKWKIPVEPVELHVSPEGLVTLNYGWHEIATLSDADQQGSCFNFSNESLEWRTPKTPNFTFSQGIRYVLVNKNDSAETLSVYYSKILNGCFQDQNHKKWCFNKGGWLSVGANRYRISLIPDQTAMPSGGVNLSIQNDRAFWHLRYKKPKGWDVYLIKLNKADEYTPIANSQPWRTLEPLD